MIARTRTPEEARALLVAMVVADAIRDLHEVPAGTLYAHLMGHMTHATFETIVDALVGAELVRRAPSHLLTWIGPAKEGA